MRPPDPPPQGEEPSADLLRRSRTGDREALGALLHRHLAGARAFARLRMSPLLRAHESGSDLVQLACLDLLGKATEFEYRGEEAFRGWFYTAVLHKVLTAERELRAQKRDARRAEPLTEPDLVAIYSRALSPSREAIAEEHVRLLEAAFDELPEHYREVITLSRIARLSRVAVAERMNRTEDAVRNLLPRALVALAEVLRAKGLAT